MIAVVVDDSPTQAQRLGHLLERAGFTVRVALNGASALVACNEAPLPAAVIADVVMPGIDGYELCRRLKGDAATARVPVLLLSTLMDPLDVVQALAAGADNFVSKPYSDARILTRVSRMIAQAQRTAGGVPGVEVHGQRFAVADASPRVLELLVSCLEDAAERNAELAASRTELALANEQREELMGIVAHELKTPLSALVLRAQLAARTPEHTDALRALPEVVARQVGRMVRLIDDLLDVSRIESGAMRIERAPGDLVALVRDAVERLRPGATQTIDARLPDRLAVEMDTPRIEQVLTNLLTNAAKYAPAGSRVVVRVEPRGAHAFVAVADEGIGVPPDALPHVFDRFYRTPDGQERAKGLGLGLYICRQLIELHGGEIGAESIPGRGSTFWFTLPLPGTPAATG